jgi:hypothetical protein
VSLEEIVRGFIRAGWRLDGSFSEYLVVGVADDGVSILASKEAWGIDNPLFELIDHERDLTYSV